MKKLVLLFILIMSVAFVSAQTAEEQLIESNIVLAMAFERITALEEQVKELTDIKYALQERLEISTNQLIESNEVLVAAYKRIEEDGKEIVRLRELLDKAVAMLEKTLTSYTVFAFPTYTITKSFGGGVAFNMKLASLPINIIGGTTISADTVSVFAGLGYSF